MERRQIDPVDAIWLNMDRANNLMVVESLMMLERPADWKRFVDVVQRRIVDRYPVFHQRPVWPRLHVGLPHWEDVPDFAVQDHVRRARLHQPGDDRALQDYVNQFIGRPLGRDKPLWEMHLIDGYGAGSAVYARLHHAMADGIALTQVLLSLTDESPEVDLVAAPAIDGHRDGGVLEAARRVLDTTGSALTELPHLVTPGGAVDAFTLARRTTGIVGKLLLTRNPDSPLSGSARPEKRAIWSEPFSLDLVKQVGHRTGTTVNDVLVSALAGSVAAYLRRHNGEAVDIPTMVPVDVRPPGEPLPRELGNKFALVLFSLPSSLETPFARLAETKRRMDAIKSSPEAVMTFGLIRGVGRTGPELERFLVDFFANKATGVTTDVPGPTSTRYVAGTRITGLLGWVPESGNQTLGTCIYSYDGQVRVGFKVDAWQIPHPEQLLDGFRDELAELLALAPAV